MFRVKAPHQDLEFALPTDVPATAAYVKQRIEEAINVPRMQQRLIFRGKVLTDDMPVAATDSAVLHILPSEAEIEAMREREAAAKREHEIRATRRVVSIQARNNQLNARTLAMTAYKFHGIETLPNLPDEATARNILDTLAQDPGILAVLAQHKWQVGALAEMFPDGKVGVDPVCVLGLNENKGQRILLRLRTDDLRGFRKYLTIKKVLYHELAHNVQSSAGILFIYSLGQDVSDHNNEFYQLMRQVENECNAVPLTTTKPKELPATRLNSAATGELQGWALLHPMAAPPPPKIAQLDVENVTDDVDMNASLPPSVENRVDEHNDLVHAKKVPATDLETHSIPRKVSIPMTTETPATNAPLAPLAEWDGMALAMGGERVQQVHDTIHRLWDELAFSAGRVDVVSTMHTLLTNILQSPHEAKFKKIRKGNPRIAKTIGPHERVCAAFLQSVGFHDGMIDDGEMKLMTRITLALDATHWTLQRDDPGLLWLGKSALEALASTNTT
ncbi:Aste57867_599 [Aphanomyces stellatus]|uniref:Aste57867_599 protein n=1 Tax=Aphanomyces stellatus TaxID=120398 RepID=A0A485K3C6_9STRA|nr:hypothetical protein As57867_000598 [Aphanomyces stellatus]VFT77824.1 Aste57867_599 [Aphanomyces stellatus]